MKRALFKKPDSFRKLSQNRPVAWVLILSFALVFLFFGFTRSFLSYNEARIAGGALFDPLISYIPAVNLSIYTFTLTYISIALGLFFSMRTPEKAILTHFSIVSLLLLRMICLLVVPLEPPSDIIPLEDQFLANTFYSNQVLLRDLFFSGHTASIVLLYFLVENKLVSRILLGASLIVASMLVVQHVHYTLDVVCAYFFAWLAVQSGHVLREYALVYARYVGIYGKIA